LRFRCSLAPRQNRLSSAGSIVAEACAAGDVSPFAMAAQTVQAAEECLARPRDAAPPGKHWYYHLVRETNHHCWYLHDVTETSSHAAISRRARRAAIVASRGSEPTLSRTTANAYAEFGLPDNGTDDPPRMSQQTLIASDYPKAARQEQPNTDASEGPASLVASRWPQPAAVPPASVEPTTSSLAVASASDAKQGAGMVRPGASPVMLTSVETAAAGTPASLQTLLLATIGAITLTGFAGSSVFLLAQMRRRLETHASLSRGPGWQSAEWVDRTRPPPWLYRDGAHEAEASSYDRLTNGFDHPARD